MIHILDIKFDQMEALTYVNELESRFKHLCWHYEKHHNDPRGIGSHNNLNQIQGWGLQTIYSDITFPYHCDIDPHDEGPEYFKDTEMSIGFFLKLKKKFPNMYRSFVMKFPSDHYIGKWKSGSGPAHGKIFIPVVSNNKTKLIDHTNANTEILEVGKIYLFDMTKNYGEFRNDSDTEITFITFNIPESDIRSVINNKDQL
jgi:hypothetical protein